MSLFANNPYEEQPPQQQPPPDPYSNTGYYQNHPKVPDSQFHLFRISFDDILQDFSNWLRGKSPETKEDGSRVYRDTHSPLLNEKGVSRVTAMCHSYLNKAIILGYLDDEQINIKMAYFWKQLAYMFVMNGADWDLDKNQRSMLTAEIKDMVHLTMTRALGGNEAEQLSTAISRIEHTDFRDLGHNAQKSSGVFGFFRGK